MKIVMFNGPSSSGKTLAAHTLRERLQYQGTIYKMSTPMDDLMKQLMGLSAEEYENVREIGIDTAHPRLHGKTLREAMIAMAEGFIKPFFGADYFGRWAVEQGIPISARALLIPDIGFTEEVVPIIEKYGPENVLGVHLSRESTSFEGDNREYVDFGAMGVDEVMICGDQGIDMFRTAVLHMVIGWLQEKKF